MKQISKATFFMAACLLAANVAKGLIPIQTVGHGEARAPLSDLYLKLPCRWERTRNSATTSTRATRISHSEFKTEMEMNGQTERCGQSRSKNSKFIKPTSLNALQLSETGPAINIRDGFVIVLDPWSGIWLKWMPGSFDETLQSGRYDFLIDPFAGDRCAADEYREKVFLWKKSFRKNYL